MSTTQNIKRLEYASKSAIANLFREIPKDAYSYISKEMGWLNESTLPTVFKATISVIRMNTIKKHLEYWRKHIEFSVASKDGIFDMEQHKRYFVGLTELINSREYSALSNNNRSKIIEEHKKIWNQIYYHISDELTKLDNNLKQLKRSRHAITG